MKHILLPILFALIGSALFAQQAKQFDLSPLPNKIYHHKIRAFITGTMEYSGSEAIMTNVAKKKIAIDYLYEFDFKISTGPLGKDGTISLKVEIEKDENIKKVDGAPKGEDIKWPTLTGRVDARENITIDSASRSLLHAMTPVAFSSSTIKMGGFFEDVIPYFTTYYSTGDGKARGKATYTLRKLNSNSASFDAALRVTVPNPDKRSVVAGNGTGTMEINIKQHALTNMTASMDVEMTNTTKTDEGPLTTNVKVKMGHTHTVKVD